MEDSSTTSRILCEVALALAALLIAWLSWPAFRDYL